MGTITKGKIGRQDLQQWGGSSVKTFSRPNSAGGVETMTAVGNVVDILAAYGSGTAYTLATINAALQSVGSSVCTFAIAPGAWPIDADVTIPANVTLWFPAGASFAIETGITVTCNGYVLAEENRRIFTGDGTFTLNTYPQQDAWWGNTAALILTTGSGALKIAQSGLVTAAGDTLYFDGTNLVKLAKGTAGHYLKQGASAPEWAALGAPAAHASGHITGGSDEIDGDKLDIDWNPTYSTPVTDALADSTDNLTAHLKGIDNKFASILPVSWITFRSVLSAGDTSHDVNILNLHCRDYANTCDIIIADITKQIDATWAAGDDAGGMADSLTVGNSTWYHLVAVAKAAGADPDVVFDTDITAANHRAANADYTKYRYLFSVLTDGSANITAYTQVGDTFFWNAAIHDVNVSDLGESAVLYTLSAPSGVKSKAKIIPTIYKSGADAYAYITSPYQNDESASTALQNIRSNNTGIQPMPMDVWTNGSSQIRARGGQATTDFDIYTIGYILPMGARVGI